MWPLLITTAYPFMRGLEQQVWSSKRKILALNRNKPQMAGSGDELAVRSDNGAFTGVKTKLRESEHYTPLFARAILEAWTSGHN